MRMIRKCNKTNGDVQIGVDADAIAKASQFGCGGGDMWSADQRPTHNRAV
ncbi:hypothetical protein J7U46_05330 [Pelomonas sp. V22]|nr:hypothetical protein [Pelomonas sp. V22]MDI4632458.1 hypothetical protein [Pelomonas sp. V22]